MDILLFSIFAKIFLKAAVKVVYTSSGGPYEKTILYLCHPFHGYQLRKWFNQRFSIRFHGPDFR